MGLSLADEIAAHPEIARELSEAEVDALLSDEWWMVARPEQKTPPGDWFVWLMRAGRGGGKTRAGAEWTRESVEQLAPRLESSRYQQALISQTLEDVRLVMVEGETGLLSVLPPSMLIGGSVDRSWNRVACELTLHHDDQTRRPFIKGFSSEKPNRLRGPQHHRVWLDEVGYLKDAHKGTAEHTTWTNAVLGCRLEPDPRMCVTGTPKNVALVTELVEAAQAQAWRYLVQLITRQDVDPGKLLSIVETHWSTYDNLANLAETWAQEIIAQYAGTTLGRQELDAELIGDLGLLFKRGWFTLIDSPPPGGKRVRYWDLAASEPNPSYPDPDWTAGVLLSLDPATRVYTIEHMARFRLRPGPRDDRLRDIAAEDGMAVPVWVEEEKAQAGKSVIAGLSRHLDGVARVHGDPVSGDKGTRAQPVAGAAEQGRVQVVRGEWNRALFDELERFDPDGDSGHKDQVDAISGAFKVLGYRRQAKRPRRQAHNQTLPNPTA